MIILLAFYCVGVVIGLIFAISEYCEAKYYLLNAIENKNFEEAKRLIIFNRKHLSRRIVKEVTQLINEQEYKDLV